jgi:hypothetical protein
MCGVAFSVAFVVLMFGITFLVLVFGVACYVAIALDIIPHDNTNASYYT